MHGGEGGIDVIARAQNYAPAQGVIITSLTLRWSNNLESSSVFSRSPAQISPPPTPPL
jgi:hypothetical protein